MPEEVAQILGKCTAEIEQQLHAMNLSQNNAHGLAVVGLLDVVMKARVARDNVSVVRVVHKVTVPLYSTLFCFELLNLI